MDSVLPKKKREGGEENKYSYSIRRNGDKGEGEEPLIVWFPLPLLVTGGGKRKAFKKIRSRLLKKP